MLSPGLVAVIAFGYLLLLFAIAYYGDRRRAQGRSVIANPYIYTLSLAVYCTAWTFFGSVGKAATQGATFLTIYLGPTIMAFFWWFVLRKMLRVCKDNNLTTMSDFLTLRYGKGTFLGALVTLGVLLAVVPYIGLQLKSVSDTFNILTYHEVISPLTTPVYHDTALYVSLVLAVFGILFGARHLDPTERHEGMVAAVAFESLIKLLAFLAIGVVVTYGIFPGWGEIFGSISQQPQFRQLLQINTGAHDSYLLIMVQTFLAMGAILFLPRQFHMAVVENTDEKHILTAIWLLPLYLLLINLFVMPIAFGGLLLGFPPSQADTFVLRIPLQSGHPYLALLTFIGGLSASTAMVAVTSITVSTMLLNSLVLPLAIRLKLQDRLPPYLLATKRSGILLVILLGYITYRLIGPSAMLVDMGLIAFCGVAQLAPAILGALYWREATRYGAIAGLGSGFLLWAYTLVLPYLVEAGMFSTDILKFGPLGLAFLKPTAFLGLTGLDILSHAFFWSLFFNIGTFLSVSLLTASSPLEQEQAWRFVDVFELEEGMPLERRYTYLPNLDQFTRFMEKFIGNQKAAEARRAFLTQVEIPEKDWGDREKLQLQAYVERTIAGSIGPAAARVIMEGYLSSLGSRMEGVFDLFGQVSSSLEESQQKLKRRVAELSVLYEAARTLTSTLYLPELIEGVLDLLVERLGVEKCSVRLLDDEGMLVIKSYRGLTRLAPVLSVKPEINTLLGQCLLTPQVISVSDTSLMGRDRLEGLLEEETMASFVLAPITTETLALGVLTAASSQKGYFAREHVEFFQSLAGQLGGAVRSAQQVAHQIRNPVHAIGGFAHLLLKKLPEGSDTRNYAEIIIKEAKRLEKMVREVVETSVIFIPREEEQDINQVVRGALGIIRSKIEEKHIDLKVELTENLPPLTMDVGNMKRVILQLVANALDAMSFGGRLKLSTAPRDDMVEVKVADNGKGIPAHMLPHIFDTFFSTKPSGPGLGLPIVHKIITQHRGEISIESKENVGTTVTIRLPTAKPH
ncbi:MAG: GAF domain-containing protein [Deltaproteobacteria bacterium]|nr:GAF domain-containing protein [Deltaproteobacteria bacterium]MBW1951749.1 GAF domain-containing protein [Deltaproteobacteria bacterium]MBW1986855.1 GAF domain-containing protein [Deltaproteobacteria bacterium]MBW2134979.1 GAF domain-containing protein [Deltaproteobacteria bacterium]